MSSSVAQTLKVKRNDRGKTVKIKDVHQTTKDATISELVKIVFDEDVTLLTSFALIDAPVESILSLPSMMQLNLKIDTTRRVCIVQNKIFQCLLAKQISNAASSNVKADTNASVIQQTEHNDPLELINKASNDWTKALTDVQRAGAIQLLLDFLEVWYRPQIGRCTTIQMEIHLCGVPKRIAVRPIPVHLRDEMNKQIDGLLNANAIEPAPECKWVSACHLVPKPRSDKWRLVIDYRYINTLIQDDGYQMP